MDYYYYYYFLDPTLRINQYEKSLLAHFYYHYYTILYIVNYHIIIRLD